MAMARTQSMLIDYQKHQRILPTHNWLNLVGYEICNAEKKFMLLLLLSITFFNLFFWFLCSCTTRDFSLGRLPRLAQFEIEFRCFRNLWTANLITFANFCELGTYLRLPQCRFYVITCICVWIWNEMESLKAVLGERVLQQVGVVINTIFNLWPRYTLGLLVDLVVGTLQIVLPGPNFGSDATYLHSMGPVATFLCGCSSGAFFLALAPGFIAGIGLSMWFSQYMEHRSLARRQKVVPQILRTYSPHPNWQCISE